MTQKLCLAYKGQVYIAAIASTDLEQNLKLRKG